MADITPRCMWKAIWLRQKPDVELIQIERHTEASVWVIRDDGRVQRERRYTSWSAIADSENAAIAAMVHALELAEHDAKCALHRAHEHLDGATRKLQAARHLAANTGSEVRYEHA